MEERVIQQESVTSEAQPVAASETPKAPEVPTVPLTEFEALKQLGIVRCTYRQLFWETYCCISDD